MGLMCIFAHPDDEAFGPSGSIKYFSKSEEVNLICVTNGGARDSPDPEKLAATRKQELIASAKVLNIQTVEFLNYQDGSLNNNLYHQLADDLTKILEKYRPETILTFDLLGVSGHIDHIVVSLVTTFVFYRLPFIHRLLYYCEQKEVLESLSDYFIYVPPGCRPEDVDLKISNAPFWSAKMAAFAAHQSQAKDALVITEIINRFPRIELFKVLEK